MFYDILITALAIALTAHVWYAIGFAFCRFGVVNLLTKISIRNWLVREIVLPSSVSRWCPFVHCT